MMFEFIHHGETKDRLVESVDEHMNANESGKEFSLMC